MFIDLDSQCCVCVSVVFSSPSLCIANGMDVNGFVQFSMLYMAVARHHFICGHHKSIDDFIAYFMCGTHTNTVQSQTPKSKCNP